MADPRQLLGGAQPAPAQAAANPFSSYPSRASSPSNPFATIGKGLLGMTGIGMVPLGIWEYQKQKERDERGRMGLEMGTGRMAELMGEAQDPQAQISAITQTIREIAQQPGMIADNPDLIPSLLQQATALREAQQSGIIKGGPGDVFLQQNAGGGLDVLGQIPTEPNALEQEMAMNMQILGMNAQDAYAHATDKFVVAQITDELTRVTTPIIINKTSGTGQVWGGQGGSGPVIPAEQLQQMREKGLVSPEQPMREAAPTHGEYERLAGMRAGEAALAGSGVQSSIGRTLNKLAGSFVPSAVDPEIQAADRFFESMNALAAKYTRDLVGSARLSGVAELHTVLDQMPKNRFDYSQTENITKTMGLHDDLMKAWERTEAIRLDEQYSPEARKEAEALGLTVQSMLELIGPKEELEQALVKARKDPKGWSRVWAQIGNMFSGAPEELARMRQESSAIQGGDLSGMDPLDFEDLLGDVVEKAKVNPQDPDLIPDEVIDKLSDEQERMLIEAIQGVLQPQAAPRQ